MSTLLTTILVLTFLGILSGLIFCIWVGYKLVIYSPDKLGLHTCKYTPIDEWSEIHDTQCGETFYNATEGSTVQDWMNYCPYCGGKVK